MTYLLARRLKGHLTVPDKLPDSPAPVTVTNPEPIAVSVEHISESDATAKRLSAAALAQVDANVLTTHGQRRINLIWEVTQALVALLVTFTTLFVSARIVLYGIEHPEAAPTSYLTAAFLLLSNAFFLVIGFYFGRTNHQRTGGVGPSEQGR